jgi:hypothetical protein
MLRAGVLETVTVSISGHMTRSTFDRYNIREERDQRDALRATEAYQRTTGSEAARKACDYARCGQGLGKRGQKSHKMQRVPDHGRPRLLSLWRALRDSNSRPSGS